MTLKSIYSLADGSCSAMNSL